MESVQVPFRGVNLVGKVFGRLTVESLAFRRGYRTFWACKCICGNSKAIEGYRVTSGLTKSCGCLHDESASRPRIHGHSHRGKWTAEYRAWSKIIYRCEDKGCDKFARYGGRGISVCHRWRESFQAFYDDMGPRPSPKHSIDRIDNNGHYEPGNCRWATKKQQARNRRNTVTLNFEGRCMCVADWAEEVGIPQRTIRCRLYRGWTVERALMEQPK